MTTAVIQTPNRLLWGAFLLIASEFMFTAMGAVIKQVAQQLPNESIVFLRNLLGVALLLPFFLYGRLQGLKTEHWRLHLLRATAGLSAMYCFFYALGNIPLAEAILLKLSAPFFIPLVAWFWLKEPITVQVRWAILLGFTGVFLILRPGFHDVSWIAWIALAGGALAAVAKVTVRRMSVTEPSSRIVFYFAFFGVAGSAAPVSIDWIMPEGELWWWVLALAMFATLGQLLMTRAYAMAPAGQIGLFGYSSVIFAMVIGWLFWGETITAVQIGGAMLIIAAGALITSSKSEA